MSKNSTNKFNFLDKDEFDFIWSLRDLNFNLDKNFKGYYSKDKKYLVHKDINLVRFNALKHIYKDLVTNNNNTSVLPEYKLNTLSKILLNFNLYTQKELNSLSFWDQIYSDNFSINFKHEKFKNKGTYFNYNWFLFYYSNLKNFMK